MEGMAGADASSSASPLHDRIPVILTHEGVSSVWKQRAARGPATRDVDHRNRIAEHVERTLGTKIELFISERQPCHGLTVDVLVVPPTDERPFYVLVTRGLSEMHMNVHPLAKNSPSRIELVICLPKAWEVSLEAFRKSEQYFWPVRQLKRHALFPAIHHTFISLGHTVANELVNDDIPPSPDNPSRPFCSNTVMNSMLMMVPALLPEEFHIMTVKKPGKKKKKKRSRKKDKTDPSGQREDAEAASAPPAPSSSSSSSSNEANIKESSPLAEKAAAEDPPAPLQQQQQEESTNETQVDEANQRQQKRQQGEPESKDAGDETQPGREEESEAEKEKEGGEVKQEGEEETEEQQQQQQDGDKKKVRRRRGGKKKNKNKNGENGKPGDAESGEGPSQQETGASAQGTTEAAKAKANEGNNNNNSKQQKGNEQPFIYGENKEDVYFYQLLPLYQEEVDFKLKHGLDSLLERLEQLPPLEVMTITPGRRNTCQMPVKRKILRAQRRASPKSAGAFLAESVVGGGGGEAATQRHEEREPEEEEHQHQQQEGGGSLDKEEPRRLNSTDGGNKGSNDQHQQPPETEAKTDEKEEEATEEEDASTANVVVVAAADEGHEHNKCSQPTTHHN